MNAEISVSSRRLLHNADTRRSSANTEVQMSKLKFASAFALAALVSSNGLALAAGNGGFNGQIGNQAQGIAAPETTRSITPPSGPVSTPDNPSVDPGNNKPAPDLPDDSDNIWKKLQEKDPNLCWFTGYKNPSNGKPFISFINYSGKTIPKGSKIIFHFPDGTSVTLTVDKDILPGHNSNAVDGPWNAADDDFSCTTTVLASARSK